MGEILEQNVVDGENVEEIVVGEALKVFGRPALVKKAREAGYDGKSCWMNQLEMSMPYFGYNGLCCP